MTDIFLSYNHEDRAYAKMFAEAFEREGLTVWWDTAIRAGDTYDVTTEKALRAARAVVVLWSPRSVASHWVRSEASIGREMGRLAPAMIETCALPVMFRLLQTAELQGWSGAADDPAWRAFIADVRGVAEAAAPTPAAEAPTSPSAFASSPAPAPAPLAAKAPTPLRPDRRLALAGLGAAGVAAAGLLAWRVAPKEKPPTARSEAPRIAAAGAPPMLAVLPFQALTKKDDDVAFADGLHEDLLSRMAKISGLKVIARASVLGFANTTKRASEIAKELGVGSLLTGSVQRAGEQVRVSVQLVDATTETQSWGESYDRPLTTENLFAIQREITEAIADATGAVLTAREMQAAFVGGTKNLDAYQAFVRGRIALQMGSSIAEFGKARSMFSEALRHDPDFAAAHAYLARAFLNEYWFVEQSVEALRAAGAAATARARALAPDTAERWMAEACLRYWGAFDLKGAELAIDNALKEAPNSADALDLKAFLLRRQGRFSEALELLNAALVLNPLSLRHKVSVVQTLNVVGAFAASDRFFAEHNDAHKEAPEWVFERGAYLACVGRPAAALAYARSAAFAGVLRGEQYALQWAVQARDHRAAAGILAAIPDAQRRPKGNPHLYDMLRANVLHAEGKIEAARALARPVWAAREGGVVRMAHPWRSGLMTPAEVPGVLGDLEGVRAAARDFETNGERDRYMEIDTRLSIAAAFARAGGADDALVHMEALEKLINPSVFPVFGVHPPFDSLRAHPRYLAMKARFEAWAKTQEPWSAE